MNWNFRIFRMPGASIDDPATYDIREAFYDDNDVVTRWTDGTCGPVGDTLESMINALAWMMKALTLPVLDAETGKEVEPAHMLADDLQKIFEDNPDSFPGIMRRAAGRG